MNEDFLLTLNYLFCDNPAKISNILKRHQNMNAFLNEGIDNYLFKQAFYSRKVDEIKERLAKFDLAKYKARLTTLGIKYLSIFSKEYPENLRQIPNPPVLFFYKGNINLLSTDIMGVVGTRNNSVYGEKVTQKFVRELTPYFTIASGGALGIDTIAHQETLGQNGMTIAVFGCGFDVDYPKINQTLFKEIEEKGLLISEYPLGAEPLYYRFPQRNRIISGLAKGVLVVEAGEKSGALITANFALEQNREVFVVPGSVFSNISIGTNKLIQQGAKLVLEIDDILSEFQYLFSKPKKEIRPTVIKPTHQEQLSQEEKQIYDLLNVIPISCDDLVSKLNLPVNKVLSSLTVLELKGLVEEVGGKKFRSKLKAIN